MNQEAKSNAIVNLTEVLRHLPGLGPKSAQRITYHLLRAPESEVNRLVQALCELKQKIKLCSSCFNVTDTDPCPICDNPGRDHARLCIVEQPQDILALEHTGVYKGLYHVPHGAISPTEGVGADNIRVKELMVRLQANHIEEIILATNTNLEGEQTAMYLNRLIAPLGIKITRLARGLPFGTELEYADDVTLTRAIEERQKF
ncbi:MAG: recombination mediator RecR [Chloroflexota bacterium]